MTSSIKHSNGWRIRWIDATGRRCSETHTLKSDASLALQRHLLEVEEVKRGLKGTRPADHWP